MRARAAGRGPAPDAGADSRSALETSEALTASLVRARRGLVSELERMGTVAKTLGACARSCARTQEREGVR